MPPFIRCNAAFSTVLRQSRLNYEFTEADMAELLEVPLVLYIAWEQGQVPVSANLAKIYSLFPALEALDRPRRHRRPSAPRGPVEPHPDPAPSPPSNPSLRAVLSLFAGEVTVSEVLRFLETIRCRE